MGESASMGSAHHRLVQVAGDLEVATTMVSLVEQEGNEEQMDSQGNQDHQMMALASVPLSLIHI